MATMAVRGATCLSGITGSHLSSVEGRKAQLKAMRRSKGVGRSTPRTVPITVAAEGSLSAAQAARVETLKILRQQGSTTYGAGTALDAAVEKLIANNPTPSPGKRVYDLGQGIWETFYAPHITAGSKLLFTTFEPLRYTLDGENFYSNVLYENKLLGKGWLSASGKMLVKDDDTVQIDFQRFWWDPAGELRSNILSEDEFGPGDKAVNFLAKLTFIEALASFPVLYLDGDGLCVFRFPPLSSNIAVRRVALTADLIPPPIPVSADVP